MISMTEMLHLQLPQICRPPCYSAEHASRILDVVFASCIRLALQVWKFLACSEKMNGSPFLLSNPNVELILGLVEKIFPTSPEVVSTQFLKNDSVESIDGCLQNQFW